MVHPLGEDTEDAARWWRAYQLAENDHVDELRKLAAAGDQHARRQLASWLSDRAWCGSLSDQAKLAEAIEVIRPVADAGDERARRELASWLAACDCLDELRQRADRGDTHALRQLAGRLADHDMTEELLELVATADVDRRQVIAEAIVTASPAGMNALRAVADLGDPSARRRLARVLAWKGRLDELRERAENGDEYARQRLADEQF